MDGKTALEFLTKYCRMSLAPFGVWPAYKNETISKTLFLIFIVSTLVTIIIPQGIQLIHVWGNLDLMSQIISTAELPFIIAFTKTIVLFYNKKQIVILYDNMLDHWERKKNSEELEIMMRNGNTGKKISLLCICLGHATMSSRLVQFMFENWSNWNSPEVYKNFTLYIEAYYPYTWNYTPMFEITCIIEYIGTLLLNNSYTGTDGFFCQIVFHISAQYHLLRLKLLDVVNNAKANSWSEFDKEFSHIVDVHYHINSCIQMLEETFYLMFLVQLVGCSIQFCMQGYLLVLYLTDNNSNSMLLAVLFIVVFLMYMIGNFYVYCYLAETLQMESFAFAETAYECEWYNLPPKKAKNLLLLMQRGNKPVQITAGKFCVLNLILFGSIIKTSMGYLSVLITMKQTNK